MNKRRFLTIILLFSVLFFGRIQQAQATDPIWIAIEQAYNAGDALLIDQLMQALPEREQMLAAQMRDEVAPPPVLPAVVGRELLSEAEVALLDSAEQANLAQAEMTRRATNRAARCHAAPCEVIASQTTPPQRAATTLTVGTNCTHDTLQAAVSAAVSGDIIHVEGKTFTGSAATVNITGGKELTIIGGYDANCTGTNGSLTTLDATGENDSVFELTGSTAVAPNRDDVVIEHFVIMGGSDDEGYGGGVEVNDSYHLRLRFSTVRDNSSTFGGGVHISGDNAYLTVDNSTIYRNSASDAGGGVYCEGNAFIQLTHNGAVGHQFIVPLGNTATLAGGGLYLDDCTLWLAGNNSQVEANRAANGGGIYATNGSYVDVNHWHTAAIVANEATSGSGGGAYVTGDATLHVGEGQIVYNTADQRGGGVYVTGDQSDVTFFHFSDSCTVEKCRQLSHNTARNSQGGGIYATGGADVMFRESHAMHNTSSGRGSAIYINRTATADTTLTTVNAIFGRNESADNFVLRYYSTDPETLDLDIEGLTFAYNSRTNGSVDTFDEIGIAGPYDADIDALIVWGDMSRDVVETTLGATASLGSSVLPADGTFPPAGNNFGIDPNFIDPDNDNFHIWHNSVAVDKVYFETVSYFQDIDGDPRPTSLPGGNNDYDAGADEVVEIVGINGAGCAYGSINDAIAAASDGDTIYITRGHYSELLDEIDKSLTLIAASDECVGEAGGATEQSVYIQGQGNSADSTGGLVQITNGATVTFTHMTLRNATATYGGVLYVNGDAKAVLDDSYIEAGSATLLGGGARVLGTLELRNNSVIRDSMTTGSGDGAGVALLNGTLILHDASTIGSHVYQNESADNGGGIYADNATIELNDSSAVLDNTATDGGGIYATNGSIITLRDSADVGGVIAERGNVVTGSGGGLYLTGANTLLEMYDQSAVKFNVAVFGGGVFVGSGSEVRAYDEARIRNNSATTGGGIYANGGTILMLETVNGRPSLHENSADSGTGRGGGLMVEDTLNVDLTGVDFLNNVALSGGGLYADNSVVDLSNVLFEGNSADTGGGLAARNGATVTMGAQMSATRAIACDPTTLAGERYCSEFWDNSAETGAAIDADNSTINLNHTALTINHGTQFNVGSIIDSYGFNAALNLNHVLMSANYNAAHAINASGLGNPHSVTLDHTTLAYNAGWAISADDDATLNVQRTIIWSNTRGTNIDNAATFTSSCNIAQTPESGSQSFDGAGDINADPQFTGTARGSYFLSAGSPAVDACSGSATVDLENVSRPQNGDGSASSSEYDMGAFERGGVPTTIALTHFSATDAAPLLWLLLLLGLLTVMGVVFGRKS